MTLELKSPAFAMGRAIPKRCTADGDDLSPALAWTGAPKGTRSFALVADDPDAPGGVWVHWLAWNIPGERRGLPEGVSPKTEASLRQGTNDFGRVGWAGPCPPRGRGSHRYCFRLHAVDRVLDLGPGASRASLEGQLHGHTLATAELMGKYHRTA